jgi:transposase
VRPTRIPIAAAPSKIRWRLADFYDAAIHADMAETTRLANTVAGDLIALTEDQTNALTEGFNRIVKQVETRIGCGYRNMANYKRRILSHIAAPDRTDSQMTRRRLKF